MQFTEIIQYHLHVKSVAVFGRTYCNNACVHLLEDLYDFSIRQLVRDILACDRLIKMSVFQILLLFCGKDTTIPTVKLEFCKILTISYHF